MKPVPYFKGLARISRMEVRKKGGGEDHFKGKTGRKFPFCSPARMETRSSHSRGFEYKNWRAGSARWGRPTQGFGQPHLGPSGSQFSLTG